MLLARTLTQSFPRFSNLLTRFALAALAVTVALSTPRAARAQAELPPGEYVPEENPGAEDEYADTDPSALTDFRPTLDPHGTWVDDPTYGQIWTPNVEEVGPNFAPYVSEGSWAYEEDYVWVSNYEWGWVPFHYGRWAWTGGRWGWIPGRVYSGAWVTWRVGSDGFGYVGWGPLAPTFAWRSGSATRLASEVSNRPGPSVFVPRDSLFAPRVGSRILIGDRLAAVAPETRPYGRIDASNVARPAFGGALRGPTPGTLGIHPTAIVRVDPANPAVSRARAYGRPSTAQGLGARPPAGRAVRRGAPVAAPQTAPRAGAVRRH